MEFFRKTFYAFQYGNISLIEEKINELLDQFVDWKFVTKKQNKLYATIMGKRVSELYIDPLTASNFITSLKLAMHKDLSEISFLQLLSNTIEMKPLLSVRVGEVADIEKVVIERARKFLVDIPEEYDLEFEDFMKSVKLSLMFEDWLNESTEDKILTKFKVAPGELRGRLELADWLIYSLNEIALLQGHKDILTSVRKLRVRMRYGIRDELIPLVRLKGIGRVRARKLFNASLTSLEKLRITPVESIAKIIGIKVANDVKKQLGEKTDLKEEKQSTLGKF